MNKKLALVIDFAIFLLGVGVIVAVLMWASYRPDPHAEIIDFQVKPAQDTNGAI